MHVADLFYIHLVCVKCRPHACNSVVTCIAVQSLCALRVYMIESLCVVLSSRASAQRLCVAMMNNANSSAVNQIAGIR